MKYFTKELWRDLQHSGEVAEEAHRRWSDGFAAYVRELESLRDRVPPDAFEFFQKADVHDGALIHLRVREFDPLAARQIAEDVEGVSDDDVQNRDGSNQLTVELSVAECRGIEWTLRYSGIRRILVDFPTESPLFYPGVGLTIGVMTSSATRATGFCVMRCSFRRGR